MTVLEQYKAQRRPSPFIVPEDYFTQVAERVMGRIHADAGRQDAAPVFTRVARWMPYVAAACVAALAFVLPRLFSADVQGTDASVRVSRTTAQQSYHEADYVYDYITAADNTIIPDAYETYR